MRLVHQHYMLQQLGPFTFEALHNIPASLLMPPQGFHQVLILSDEAIYNEFLCLIIRVIRKVGKLRVFDFFVTKVLHNLGWMQRDKSCLLIWENYD